MTRNSAFLAALVLALAACDPGPPPERGVGFGDFNELEPLPREGRTSELDSFVEARRISEERVVTLQAENEQQTLEPLDSLELLAEQAIDTAEAEQADAQIEPATPGGNAGISDEQDFDAVASRESIESDRERLAAQREAYQVIQPGELPTRSGESGASVVEFALATTHEPGVAVYQRTGLSGQARFDRNCAKYPSQDLAQAAFLAAGGPERDRFGIDPDGDGYACYWDPRPFRSALSQ